jgi:hypothetical protein
MEGLVERNDLVLVLSWRYGLSDLARKLKGRFVGFRAAIAYEGPRCGRKAAGSVGKLDELFREKAGVGIVVEIGGVD